jgi:hypothetical protein
MKRNRSRFFQFPARVVFPIVFFLDVPHRVRLDRAASDCPVSSAPPVSQNFSDCAILAASGCIGSVFAPKRGASST